MPGLKYIVMVSALAGFLWSVPAAERRPNILFCIADDASYQHFSAYGCKWVHTPSFDRVAKEGILFDRAYTPNAKCAPSRAIVLTGRNSWGLESAADHGGFYPPGYTTFMEALGSHGYVIGYTGKGWAPGNPGKIEGRPRELTGPEYSGIKTRPPTSGISPIDYAANFADFLQHRPPGQPFCFWYGGHEPHRAYEYGSGAALGKKSLSDIDRVPPYWPDTPEVRNDLLDYGYEIEYFDRQLGRILDLLEKSGEAANTLVVVTSDNGMPFPRGKGTTYELSLHMPLALRWPAQIPSALPAVHDYVSFTDFAPTFLEAAGVGAAESGMAPMMGRSLMDIIHNTDPGPRASARASFVFGQERHDLGRPNDVGYPVRGIFSNGFLYFYNFEPTRWPMCDPVTGYLNTDGGPTKTAVLDQNRAGINHWQWELDFGRRPAEEMYNLAADPDCLNNISTLPTAAAMKGRLHDQLFAELRAQKDPRLEGQGARFDNYPHASPNRDFYNRYMKGEKLKAGWVEPSDFEQPGFDPERPLAPKP